MLTEMVIEMERIYLAIKEHGVISIPALAKHCELSSQRVRAHLKFFDWYGIAGTVSTCKDDYGNEFRVEAVLVTERNINFVENKFHTTYDFFKDASVEMFPIPKDD